MHSSEILEILEEAAPGEPCSFRIYPELSQSEIIHDCAIDELRP